MTDAQHQLDGMLGPLAGARMPGGCDDCDAYQVPEQHSPGVWVITVHHDDTCPTLRRIAGPKRWCAEAEAYCHCDLPELTNGQACGRHRLDDEEVET